MSDVSTGAPATSPSTPSAPSAPAATSAPAIASKPPASLGGGASTEHQSPIEQDIAANKSTTPTPEAQPKPETPAEKAKYKMKVNGKEAEYDIDTIIRKAQLAESAEMKYQEAAATRKQVDQFVEMLQKDPLSVLTHPELGLNFRELAEQYLGKELQRETMDPVQRELEDLRAFKQAQEESHKTQQQREQEAVKQREFDTLKKRAADDYDRQITEALNKTNLPKTPYAVKRLAEVLYNAQTKGYDLDIQTAVDMVQESYVTDLQALVGGLDGDALLKILGADTAKKIRKYDIAGLKAKMQPNQAAALAEQASKQEPRAASASKPSTDKLSPDEWREMLRKKAGV